MSNRVYTITDDKTYPESSSSPEKGAGGNETDWIMSFMGVVSANFWISLYPSTNISRSDNINSEKFLLLLTLSLLTKVVAKVPRVNYRRSPRIFRVDVLIIER